MANSPMIEARQADAAHGHDHEYDREQRHGLGESAEVRNLSRVAPLIYDAHDEEERRRRNAVIDHLEHAPRDAIGVHGEQAQHAHAQVTHGGVGHQLLHILLDHGHQRAIDDPDEGEG